MESDDGVAARAAATGDVDAGASSSGEPALKRQRTDGGGISVKTEKKEDAEHAFEPIDVVNALGDGGGSDVIREFESNWKDDHDKVLSLWSILHVYASVSRAFEMTLCEMYAQAIDEMKKRICEVVDKVTDDDRPLFKAIEYLEALRDKCDNGVADEPEVFNKVWDELDRKYRNHQSIKFWDKVLAKGNQLSRLKIDADEDDEVLNQPADAPMPAAANDLGCDDEDFD